MGCGLSISGALTQQICRASSRCPACREFGGPREGTGRALTLYRAERHYALPLLWQTLTFSKAA
ncbi:hypothetical protein MPLB_1870061 [Mesorhizobium sp. ORS 3324]|nr:hypothetical protein MPLB_1870061 [Mesorhizobium sp. ORS 3324]